jgi:hypothetical protein
MEFDVPNEERWCGYPPYHAHRRPLGYPPSRRNTGEGTQRGQSGAPDIDTAMFTILPVRRKNPEKPRATSVPGPTCTYTGDRPCWLLGGMPAGSHRQEPLRGVEVKATRRTEMSTILVVVLGSALVSLMMFASDRVKARRLTAVRVVAVGFDRWAVSSPEYDDVAASRAIGVQG